MLTKTKLNGCDMVDFDPLTRSILVYLLCVYFLWVTKPDIMFDEEGKPKQLGTDRGETIANVWLVSFLVGLLGYNY
mgnify:CR=1 FL=1